jgi:hypothetical protein
MDVLTNNSANTILFHEINKPLKNLLNNPDYLPEHDSAKKLTFEYFVNLLLYFYFSGLDSLRSLITDLKTKDVSQIGLFVVGLSTIHDAFCRYQASLFQQLYLALLKVAPPRFIEEFQALGPIVLVDGSIFPIAISAIWAEYKTHCNAVKLHLGFSLNDMLTSCFLVTAASYDERKALAQLIEIGVTYIADRGYLSFELFKNINDKPAYFIIRVRKRLHYEIEQQLAVQLIDAVKTILFHVTDELVRFNSDSHGRTYRRISFRTRQTLFILVTNRFDLTTFEIIRLYAFRWQIELFFRYFKRTLKAIHLLNIYENGVTTQFYLVLIAHLLALRYKQQQLQLCLFKKTELAKLCSKNSFASTEDFIESLGKSIPINFKIKKQEWNAIKNSLLKCVQLTFDFL